MFASADHVVIYSGSTLYVGMLQKQNGRPYIAMKAVRSALHKANLPAEQYAGHSFRIGAVTTDVALGIED